METGNGLVQREEHFPLEAGHAEERESRGLQRGSQEACRQGRARTH